MCSSTCPTPGAHKTLGACLRAKGVKVTGVNGPSLRDTTIEKKWTDDLNAYERARNQGIQPANTSRQAVDDAVILSDIKGEAFQA